MLAKIGKPSDWTEPPEKEDEISKCKNEPTIKSKVKDFCLETTAHGVGNLVKDDRVIWVKVLWLVIILTVVAGVLTHLALVFREYSEYKTHETTEILHETPEFPYVTICNTEAISQNHSFQYGFIDNETDYVRYFDLLVGLENEIRYINHQLGENAEDLLLSPQGIFANVNSTTAQAIGHYLKDLVLNCVYMTIPCDTAIDWTRILNSQYFNCYTYTGGKRTGSTATGPNNGLSLLLYLENHVASLNEYSHFFNTYSYTENAYGARLVVHEPGTLPSPKDFGIDIMPGHSTSVGIQETKIKKLEKPWGDCANQKRLKEFEMYRYDEHNCLSLCIAKFIEKECGCAVYSNSMPDDIELNVPYCEFVDNDTVTYEQFLSNIVCAYDSNLAFVQAAGLREKCGCKEACSYGTYDLTVSQNNWPGSRYHVSAFDNLVMRRDDREELLAYHQVNPAYQEYIEGVSDGRQFAQIMYENFARVNIYYETQNVILRKQVRSVSMSDLFSNVGGTLGLWAGLSVVTIIELISLVVSLFGVLTRKCRKLKQGRVMNNEMKA